MVWDIRHTRMCLLSSQQTDQSCMLMPDLLCLLSVIRCDEYKHVRMHVCMHSSLRYILLLTLHLATSCASELFVIPNTHTQILAHIHVHMHIHTCTALLVRMTKSAIVQIFVVCMFGANPGLRGRHNDAGNRFETRQGAARPTALCLYTDTREIVDLGTWYSSVASRARPSSYKKMRRGSMEATSA